MTDQVIKSIADELSSLPSEHDVRFAAVEYSDNASVVFDFNDFSRNGTAAFNALHVLKFNPGGAQLAHTGMDKVTKELLAGGKRGFREFNVPLIIFMLTDGNPTDAPNSLLMSAKHHLFENINTHRIVYAIGSTVDPSSLSVYAGKSGTVRAVKCLRRARRARGTGMISKTGTTTEPSTEVYESIDVVPRFADDASTTTVAPTTITAVRSTESPVYAHSKIIEELKKRCLALQARFAVIQNTAKRTPALAAALGVIKAAMAQIHARLVITPNTGTCMPNCSPATTKGVDASTFGFHTEVSSTTTAEPTTPMSTTFVKLCGGVPDNVECAGLSAFLCVEAFPRVLKNCKIMCGICSTTTVEVTLDLDYFSTNLTQLNTALRRGLKTMGVAGYRGVQIDYIHRRGSIVASASRTITLLSFFKLSQTKLAWRCVVYPNTLGAGCKTRLESRILNVNPRGVLSIGGSGRDCGADRCRCSNQK